MQSFSLFCHLLDNPSHCQTANQYKRGENHIFGYIYKLSGVRKVLNKKINEEKALGDNSLVEIQ